MSATETIGAARALGIRFSVDGDDLVLEARSAPPVALLNRLAEAKSDILALLKSGMVMWGAGDWQSLFEERVAIAELEGNFGHLDAELIAFEDCVDRWIVHYPPLVASQSLCAVCARAADDSSRSNIVIAGRNGSKGILHNECAPKWANQTRWQARRALMWLFDGPRLSKP